MLSPLPPVVSTVPGFSKALCSRLLLLPSAGPLGILLLTRYSLCISFGHHANDNVRLQQCLVPD